MTDASLTSQSHRAARYKNAFSLVEVLVVVALLSVIVLGLMAMFSQTQRAFRVGTSQTDVLEAGRAAMDLISRDLAEMTPANDVVATNFFAEFVPELFLDPSPTPPFLNTLPGGTIRTNFFHDMFFLSRENQTWRGIGYFVYPVVNGVGTLYRTNATTPVMGVIPLTTRFSNLFSNFNSARLSGLTNSSSQVIDGVVHFKIRAFDTNGTWVTRDSGSTNYAAYFASMKWWEVSHCAFRSNAIPGAVEIELGIVEPQTLRKLRALPPGTTGYNNFWASNVVGHMHLFRQRVALRTLDPQGYQ